MTKIKPVILFDLDGVIADSWEGIFTVCCQLLHKLEHPQLCNQTAILKMLEDNFLTGLLKAISPKSFTSEHFKQLNTEMQAVMAGCTTFKGIPEMLYALAETYPLYLVTSNNSEAARHFLENHQLNYFTEILGSDHEPSKIKKIHSIQALHPGEDLYYIGDTLGDLREAQRANAIAIAAGWGWHDQQTLMRGQPAHYFETPEDLCNYFKSRSLQQVESR